MLLNSLSFRLWWRVFSLAVIYHIFFFFSFFFFYLDTFLKNSNLRFEYDFIFILILVLHIWPTITISRLYFYFLCRVYVNLAVYINRIHRLYIYTHSLKMHQEFYHNNWLGLHSCSFIAEGKRSKKNFKRSSV